MPGRGRRAVSADHREPGRALLLAGWIALLVLAALYVRSTLVVDTDLRLFLPAATNEEQHLLLEELGEGPASRLLLIALEGAAPEALAQTSIALAAALEDDPTYTFVANGRVDAGAIPERLLPCRYLLTTAFDDHPLDAATLRRALESRLKDLASPAAAALEEWLPRDPTLEVLGLAERWQPAHEPSRRFDVWFDPQGARALLLTETRAAGYDPDAQQAAITGIESAFERSRGDPAARLVVSGPGAFSVLMKERTRSEASSRGALATVAVIVIMLVAYRSARILFAGLLPLASAVLAGLVAVLALFGRIHGITLAFGFTLLGVAQDYPVHLFSHLRAGVSPTIIARRIWPTLATGVVSTCIAYMTFAFAGVPGLTQLACFTVVGLAVAGLTTRYLLPTLVHPAASAPLLPASFSVPGSRPAGRGTTLAVAALFVVAAVLIAAGRTPLWENRLSALTPVPRALIERDAELRAALGAPDVRHLLIVQASTADAVLAREEALEGPLRELVARGAIAGFDAAARYLPSRETQLHRRKTLPDRDTLAHDLDQATAGLPFRADLFAPFRADVAAARTHEPLTLEDLAQTPLGSRLESLLYESQRRWIGLITLSGVADPAPLAEFAQSQSASGVTLLDLRRAAEDLVVTQREHILRSVAVALLALISVVVTALRRPRRVLRVIVPLALALAVVVAVLRTAGVSLDLFALISLVLVAGLGLDYALFFERAGIAPDERRRTLHAVLVCAASTLTVFGLLATSSLPVLRSIGFTVGLGVLASFLFAVWLAARGGERSD
jgi:predicted exporter